MIELDPKDYQAEVFTLDTKLPYEEAVVLQGEAISKAIRQVIKFVNEDRDSFIEVGSAGYLVRRFVDKAPPAQRKEREDLVRTEWETPIAEGDWVLKDDDPGVAGSEIP